MTDGDEPTETGSTLPRRQLGRFLREAREGAGLTVEQAATVMEWNKSTLSRLERGLTEKVRVRDVLSLCDAYGLDDKKTAAAKSLAEQTPAKSWWHAYADLIPAHSNLFVGLEAGAKVLTIFQPLIVPGLLQTADYARALDRTYFPADTESELDRRIELRTQRQHVILRQRRPAEALIVLHEAVLHTVVGSRRAMAAQLRHIADLSTRENIEIRLMPFRAGFPLGMPLPPFIIFQFGKDPRGKLTEPTVVFAESFAGAMYFERPTEVGMYREAFNKVQHATLDARPSRDLIREIAREHDSER
ncbi:helix-turn-helix domain-containing protein [Nocardia jejuensis]|uniref:helix-turn-helix domain-containing protein n=1 Tax=Nocardia jejuensis TaxID=328049 RepID=UPI0008359FD1|nr:helix-turn-helix transcriptional regulator [Nocardia jejuensis]